MSSVVVVVVVDVVVVVEVVDVEVGAVVVEVEVVDVVEVVEEGEVCAMEALSVLKGGISVEVSGEQTKEFLE